MSEVCHARCVAGILFKLLDDKRANEGCGRPEPHKGSRIFQTDASDTHTCFNLMSYIHFFTMCSMEINGLEKLVCVVLFLWLSNLASGRTCVL